jgi:hypothetical protein
MAKRLIHIRVDEDYINTMEKLRQKVLKDGELHFFKFATTSDSDWFNYIISAGCTKTLEDFEAYKKMRKVE